MASSSSTAPSSACPDVGITDADIEEAEKHAEAQAAVCEICTAKNVDRSFVDHFGVAVCWSCKKADVTDNYKLVSKTTARSDFLLTEKDFEGLGCIEKPNPRGYSAGGPMKLYMRRQALELALARHGSMEALQEEKLKRAVTRFESAGKGSGKNKKRKSDGGDGSVLSGGSFLSVKLMPPTHVHSFPASSERLLNKAEGLWQKSCEQCGFTVEFEKL